MSGANVKHAVADRIDALSEHGAEVLMDLIRFPSVCGEDMDAVEFWRRVLDAASLQPRMVPMNPAIKEHPAFTPYAVELAWEGRGNLVAEYGGPDGRSLILNAHLDVIPAQTWPTAFEPKREGDVIVGRGAADDKGGAVAQYLALRALRECGAPLAGRVSLQVVIDEETGGNGTLSLLVDGYTGDAAMVAECTSNVICPANRGALWFQLTTTGLPTHMGEIDRGVSAFEKANQAIAILKEYEQHLIENSLDYAYFQGLPNRPIQLCIGMVQAGEWPSEVPGVCRVEGGIGFLPNKGIEEIKSEMREWICERGDEWLRDHFELRFDKLHNDAYETPPDHPFVQCAQGAAREAGLRDGLQGWTVSCDARLFPTVAGIPAVTFGPGELIAAHSSHEEVRLSHVIQAAKVYALTALDWCGLD